MTKGTRELQLDRRDKFLADPIFRDILNDKALQRRLEVFKRKDLSLLSDPHSEAPHNLQVTASNDKFMIQLELPGFLPDEFSLKTRDDVIILEANHEAKTDLGQEFTERKYHKEFHMPEGVQPEHIQSTYSSDGILTIEAPRVVTAPPGASVQEALAAKSKAYTMDGGKTAVSEKSQSASQMLAATTASPDGTTTSSITFSSSTSSSSSVVTSGGSGGIGSGSLSMEMDDMMKRMMNMGGGGIGRGIQTDLFSRGMTRPPFQSAFGSIGGIRPLDIEELSSAGSEISSPPPQLYTVTSPPPSTAVRSPEENHFPELTQHRVRPTRDFDNRQHTSIDDPQVDHTVLLKLKEGTHYKLVLNMQQYRPENITIKLNDSRQLTVTAHDEQGHRETFVQRHVVPKGVDLDQLTSSFSADGILVIKAPKIKKK